jgi:hypothetical protein
MLLEVVLEDLTVLLIGVEVLVADAPESVLETVVLCDIS